MKKLLAIILALASIAAHATVTQPILIPKITFVDASGSPCAGCSLYSYIAGTTTPLVTYTNAGGTVSNTNPVVLDAAGGAVIWLGQTAYKFVLKDASGGTIWTVDNVVSMTTLGCLGNNAIDHGCTGATTRQGAATNIVDLSDIKPAKITNANVNGIATVTQFGAIGDCTPSSSTASCTDNHDAIQATIDAAYDVGASVLFPTNPDSAINQTIYYTSKAINPKGVSMFGPPGAGGASNTYASTIHVGVRGAPGKDVFAVVDASDPAYIEPLPSYTVADLGIIVDQTVDASASFANRRPGRRCDDVAATGTAVVTSAAQCEFQPGDVGQAIKVGSTTTTVLSWQSATQVTLNATVTTGTNLSTYISVYNLSVTQNIGNCAFAYDDKSATFAGTHPDRVTFSGIVIQTVNGSAHTNNTCGFFFQGNESPTHTLWANSFISAMFPFAFVPASDVAPSTSNWTGMGDFNAWDHVWLSGTYPWLSYSGGIETVNSMQISGGLWGPQILNAYGIENYAIRWWIHIPEFEVDQPQCASGTTGLRLAGRDHYVQNFDAGFCGVGQGIQWDANESTTGHFAAVNVSNFNITGYHNTINIPYNGNTFSLSTAISNTGYANTVTTGSNGNAYSAVQPNLPQYAWGGASAFGLPSLSRSHTAFDRKSDFLQNGANYYFSNEDMWLWPKDLGNGSSGMTVSDDANSDTGTAFLVPLGTIVTSIEANGTNFTIGQQIPAGKFRMYFRVRSGASTTDILALSQAFYSAAWHDIGCNITIATGATTTYQTASCDVDATGLAGDLFRFRIGAGTNDAYVGWVGVRPYDSAPYGNYAGTISHSIAAIWTGASGVLVDDGEGGSGYESGAVSWGSTITGTYYVDCFTSGWTGGGTLGRKIVATVIGFPLNSTTFTYGVDVPTISAARGSTFSSVTCMAIQ